MCGYVAVMNLDGTMPDVEMVRRMTQSIRHRGPDDTGVHVSDRVALGFRRLAILDLSLTGHQPMLSADNRVVLVFNGEIYNYRELRSELLSLGHEFRSTGDTEVLLHAYLQWGSDCVRRLNGMWSFVIYDKRRQVLFGSRDRFGIKPLFVHRSKHSVLIGSEIKALKASGILPSATDWSIAADFLLTGRLDHSRRTFHAGVERFPAGHCFEADVSGGWKEWSYWSLDNVPSYEGKDPAGDFADLFEDAMRLHLRSDVPVGVHLSGGLDSTSIVCAAARLRVNDPQAPPLMAISYIAEEFDEKEYIDETVRYCKAHLVRLESDPPRFWKNLQELLWFQDEPVHSPNLLVGYELMRLTAERGVKVVLNGQGADETLAGYSSYFRDFWSSLLRDKGLSATRRQMAAYTAVHGGFTLALLTRQLRHLAQGLLAANAGYRSISAWSRRRTLAADDWFDPDLKYHVILPPVDAALGLRPALRRSIFEEPLPIYLRVEDRISMAHSIESRLPFLDHRLVAFAFGLPVDWLMRGGWNKYILREAMKGRIPEKVRLRPNKFGFPVPSRNWLSGPLYQPVRDLLSSQASRERGIFNTGAILRDLERHRRGLIDASARIFDVVQFEAWSQLTAAENVHSPRDAGRCVA